MNWQRKLKALGACEEALIWAKDQPDFATAWTTCTRGKWMFWLLPHVSKDCRAFVRIACDCAEKASARTKDPRVMLCVGTVRAWLDGRAQCQHTTRSEEHT